MGHIRAQVELPAGSIISSHYDPEIEGWRVLVLETLSEFRPGKVTP